jgi:hypothetical protein
MLPHILNMLGLLVRSLLARTIRKPSCEVRSLLLAKDPSVKIKSFARARSSGTYDSPWVGLLICYWIRAFKALMSSFDGSVVCAAIDRSNAASGWHIEAIYAPLALCST